MKTFTTYVLTTALSVGLTAAVSAQNTEVQRQEREVRNAMMQSFYKNARVQERLAAWNAEKSTDHIGDLFSQVHFKEAFGEQGQKIWDSLVNIERNIGNDPDYKSLKEEAWRLHDSPLAELALRETQEKLLDIQLKMNDIRQQQRINVINETLTPDQIKIVQEYQITTMSGDPRFSQRIFNTFGVLGLSDEQKRQFEEIKREFKPEFEKFFDWEVEREMTRQQRTEEEMDRRMRNVTDPAERHRIMMEVFKEIDNDPNERQKIQERHENYKAMVDKLKFRIFDVLTDEQLERVSELTTNPPDYIKKILDRLSRATDNKNYIPGPGAWQPGSSAIPEQYRQERNNRFPSGKN